MCCHEPFLSFIQSVRHIYFPARSLSLSVTSVADTTKLCFADLLVLTLAQTRYRKYICHTLLPQSRRTVRDMVQRRTRFGLSTKKRHPTCNQFCSGPSQASALEGSVAGFLVSATLEIGSESDPAGIDCMIGCRILQFLQKRVLHIVCCKCNVNRVRIDASKFVFGEVKDVVEHLVLVGQGDAADGTIVGIDGDRNAGIQVTTNRVIIQALKGVCL